MKNTLLTERLQQLAGIKSLHEFYPDDTPDEPGYTGQFPGEDEAGMAPRYDALGSAGTDKRTRQIISDILQLIKSTDIDPMDVMEEIGVEFKIKFEFSGGAPGFKQAGTDAGFDMRGIK